MNSDVNSWLAAIKKADANRPDFPGEHLIVLAVGMALMLVSLRSRSLIKKAGIGAAAGALIGRAATGSGGIAKVAAKVDQMRAALHL